MAIHSSIIAWRTPWIEEPGGLQSMGLQRVGHGWSDLACTHTHTHTHSLSLSSNVYAFPVLSFHIYIKLVILPELPLEVNTLHRSCYICQSDIFCTKLCFQSLPASTSALSLLPKLRSQASFPPAKASKLEVKQQPLPILEWREASFKNT